MKADDKVKDFSIGGPKAIPFIYLDQNDKFEISEEAIKVLDPPKGKMGIGSAASKNKIAVLCVAGAYRTGKSFLMNQIIGH